MTRILQRSLSISLPAHIVARATLIDNTLIFPLISLKVKQQIIIHSNQ